MRIARAGLWAAGAALCGLKLAGTLRGHVDGRPDSRTGILLTAVPIVGLLTDPIVFAGSRVQHPRPRAADRRDHPRWELHLEPWSPEHPRYSSWN